MSQLFEGGEGRARLGHAGRAHHAARRKQQQRQGDSGARVRLSIQYSQYLSAFSMQYL